MKIVGSNQNKNDSDKKRIDDLIKIFDLTKKVIFLGPKTHKETMHEYKKANIFVASPLWPEPSALSVQEALCAGCKVFVNNNGGIKEFVKSEQVFNTAEELAERIVKAIHHKERINIKDVLNNIQIFNPERAVKDFINIYSKWKK